MTDYWIYKGKPLVDSDIPEKSIGFLYKIVQISTGKWYIGRKLMTKAGTRMIKNKKGISKKTKVRLDNDWRNYWSSNEYLMTMIETEGTENFTKEILLFVGSLSAMQYSEEKLLYVTGAMEDENCFNSNIRAKIFKKNIFSQKEMLENLNSSIKDLTQPSSTS